MKKQSPLPVLFPMISRKDTLEHETKEFCASISNAHIDDALAWLDESYNGQRVAVLRPSSAGQAFVMLPTTLYHHLDDLANSESYLPHWELDGILLEDLPVLKDLIVAANDDMLRTCVREVLSGAIYPSEKPNIAGACGYICRMTNVLRRFDYDPCNSIVMLPYCRHRVGDEGVIREVQTIALSFDNARKGNVVWEDKDRIVWWRHTLGLRAWFGGMSIRDQYYALAWLLCTVHADGLGIFGVWMGDRPAREYNHPSAAELNKRADEDLRQRAKSFVNRLRNPKDLTTMSFECDSEDYNLLVQAFKKCGLSFQNGIHIALRRMIAWYESADHVLEKRVD